MKPLQRNIELKARYADFDSARAALQNLGAIFTRTMVQVDTYFRVSHGRLKLREIDGHSAELIGYDRPDSIEYRSSCYAVVPVPDPTALKSVLVAANGLRGEVRKARDLWMYHNVRIHLDQIAGLGNFIEFEAVMSEGEAEETSLRRLAELHKALGILEADHQAVSYSDLLGI